MIKASRGSILPITLISSVIIGFIAIAGLLLNPNLTNHGTSMFINPNTLSLTDNQKFSIDVIVKSDTPVNAFTGVLEFDENKLRVGKIDYNTSIANL